MNMSTVISAQQKIGLRVNKAARIAATDGFEFFQAEADYIGEKIKIEIPQ